MLIQSINASFTLPVCQVFPQYVGIMRPHVGHRIVCVMEKGVPTVKCADCNAEISGTFHNPYILECVRIHVGHDLKCVTRENEVYVTCACGRDVVGSTPF